MELRGADRKRSGRDLIREGYDTFRVDMKRNRIEKPRGGKDTSQYDEKWNWMERKRTETKRTREAGNRSDLDLNCAELQRKRED